MDDLESFGTSTSESFSKEAEETDVSTYLGLNSLGSGPINFSTPESSVGSLPFR